VLERLDTVTYKMAFQRASIFALSTHEHCLTGHICGLFGVVVSPVANPLLFHQYGHKDHLLMAFPLCILVIVGVAMDKCVERIEQ